jgi:DNA-binding SARP family transcriptional activator
MQFKILGPLEVLTGNHRSLSLGASKTGQLLALLLVRAGETVSVDTLMEELWGDRPPRSALTTLQTYVYHARRMFAREELTEGRQLLTTRPPGYSLELAEDEVDARVFESRVRGATGLLDSGHPQSALVLLEEGLRLWRGPAFSSVVAGSVLDAHACHLGELRIHATQLRITAERSIGRQPELIPELRSLVATHPLNEWFHAQLIELLYRSGRRAEALEAFHRLRMLLRRELGVDPSPEIQRLHLEVLQGGRQREAPDRLPDRSEAEDPRGQHSLLRGRR